MPLFHCPAFSYLTISGASRSATAKSFLHEICTANCWKPPVFQCCDESGPSHLKRYVNHLVNNTISMNIM